MSRNIAALVIILLGCIWGTSYILIFQGLKAFEPIQVAGFRLVLATLVMLPWVYKYAIPRVNIGIISGKDHLFLILSGFIGTGIPSFLFSYAGKSIPSALSGILTALTPMFTVLMGRLVFGELITRKNMFGIIVGLTGVLTIFFPALLKTNVVPVFPAMLALLAAIMYGYNINLIKYKLNHLPGMVKTAFPFFYVAIPYFFILWYTGAFEKVAYGGPEVWTAFGYLCILAILGSAVSMILFNWIIKYTSPVVASTNTFVIPMVATLWGIANKELLTWNILAGLAIIIVSLVIILRKKQSQKLK